MDAVVAATLVAQSFPAGTVAGAVVAKLLAADGSVVATQSASADPAAPSASVTFPSVADGTYTVSVERQDGSGVTLGDVKVSDPFTVTSPQSVSITVADSVSVSVA